MKFLLDTHLPPRLVREFVSFGHDCLQARTLLAPDASDVAISQLANDLAAVMVTKDADYVDLAGRGILRTPMVWVRLGNTTSVVLCDEFRRRIPELLAALESGERIVQVLDQ